MNRQCCRVTRGVGAGLLSEYPSSYRRKEGKDCRVSWCIPWSETMCLSLNESVLTSGGDSNVKSLDWIQTDLAWNPGFAVELLSDLDELPNFP